MREILLSCEMLQDEFAYVMEQTGIQIPVEWVDAGLHEYPERLRAALEERLRRLEREYDTILLGFALCGNALVGIGSQTATLVAPRTDDCVRMLLWNRQGDLPDVDCHCLYYTGTWTKRDKFIGREYEHYCEKYGEKKTKRIYQSMLRNYTGVRMIDTGAYDVAACAPKARAASELLGLDYGEVPGTLRILYKLLRHEWDEEFYILPPGQNFEQMAFLPHCAD